MLYKSDLTFLLDVLGKSRIMSLVASFADRLSDLIDSGAEQLFGLVESRDKTLGEYIGTIKENTLYRAKEKLGIEYIYLVLPGRNEKNILLVGPYAKRQHTQQSALELAEKYKIDPRYHKLFQNYLISLPTVSDGNSIYNVIETFCEHIWGIGGYSIEELDRTENEYFSFISSNAEDGDERSILASMRLMEERYHYENELIRYVSQGQTARAEMLLSNFSAAHFEKRVADNLRNVKNYCIITNTLLRKAVEQGGVHPLNIDKTSSDFAVRIERCSNVSECTELMRDMFRSYCKLVNKFSTRELSPIVQKVVFMIDSDISSDLSLSGLAEAVNVSSGYLSSIFKREIGSTVMDYIIAKRMKHACYLLSSTHLQIQTVALHCGIMDVQYFSKLFKKKVGMTPREYRSSCKSKL